MQSSEQEPVHVAPGEGAMRRVVGDFVTFKMVVELHPWHGRVPGVSGQTSENTSTRTLG